MGIVVSKKNLSMSSRSEFAETVHKSVKEKTGQEITDEELYKLLMAMHIGSLTLDQALSQILEKQPAKVAGNVGADRLYAVAIRVPHYGSYDSNASKGLFDQMELSSRDREIARKLFYDEKGSKLFDEICDLDEYYPTRTETKIMSNNIEEIASYIGDECILVEHLSQ